jgi:hypothetical protein
MDSDQAVSDREEAKPESHAGHGLRRGILFGLLFATPFWAGLAYTVWWLLR